jgi:hypothetical protein
VTEKPERRLAVAKAKTIERCEPFGGCNFGLNVIITFN